MSASIPSPRQSGSITSRSTLPSPRRPPPIFNPAFTSAAGVTKDPESFERTRRNVAKTFKVGEHHVQFFVKRRARARPGLDQGAEYVGRGTYVGDWEADTSTTSSRGWTSKRWGVGTQVYPNGSRYEGYWFDDKQNGEGKLFVQRSAPSGSDGGGAGTPRKSAAKLLVLEYSGSWYCGKKHGFGKQTYPNGDVYEGIFCNDVRQGEGRCAYSDGSVYSGCWESDARCGLGECVLPSGDSYYGAWDCDEKHGQGAHVYKSKGRIYEGEWVRGVPRAGEMRDFLAGSGAAPPPYTLQATTTMPLLRLLDPRNVLRDACMAASGRFSGGGDGNDGGGAVQQGGGRGGTRGSADTGYSTELSEVFAGGGGGSGGNSTASRPNSSQDASEAQGAFSFDPGLTRENLEVLAAAFTMVDVTNSGFISADPAALVYILQHLSIDPPSDEDLISLLDELVQNTIGVAAAREGSPARVSFQAFVHAMGKVKE